MPASSPTPSDRAVFISYAREDAAAAGRIAEALRANAVEVWFDQSELRGGDAWDQKIRRQIDACTLFVAVISRNTEERGKGYFRLEWKLAVEQTHLLREGVPFLVPVVVDDTPDSSSAVPPEFRRVQWTRVPGGLPSQEFVSHIRRLLDGRSATAAPEKGAAAPPRPLPQAAPAGWASWKQWAFAALLLAVGLAGWLIRRPPPAPTAPPAAPAAAAPVDPKSIAVLPFENMSEDKDSLFFTDGIHEDILTNLALIRDLHVVSRTSVMQYRGTTKTIRQIGSELHVAYVLEGSVRRAGNKVRVTGQLINAQTDEHVWAKAYDHDLNDIFAIQTELSQEIAGALAAALSPRERVLIDRHPTDNLAAYELFLRGRDSFNRAPTGSPNALRQTEALYQKAVDEDPKFAVAWASLAEIDALFMFWGFDHTAERQAKGDAALANAVRLAPESPDVIRAIGTYAYYANRDYVRATEQYEKIARLQPNDPTVFSSLGLIQRRQGQFALSLANLHKAIELDPGNAAYRRNLLQSLRMGRRWDEAIAVEQRLVAMIPEEAIRERIIVALLDFQRSGSFQASEALLASLSPAELSLPRVIEWRKTLASWKGDYPEFKRLDALQPYFDVDGMEHYLQALNAAETFATHGDASAMRSRLGDFPAQLRSRIEGEPTNAILYANLVEMEALLGRGDEGVRLAQRASELVPDARDRIDGPYIGTRLASTKAWAGDKTGAVADLGRILKEPSIINPNLLRVDDHYSPLRGDPAFAALIADPANSAPAF